jgi:hypothetical protein
MKWLSVLMGAVAGLLLFFAMRRPELLLWEDGPLGEWCE